MDIKKISEFVTLVAASVGMGLGIYNFCVERSKRKVTILVQPKSVMRRIRNSETGAIGVMTSLNEFDPEYLDEYFAIELVNLSNFPVTIDNVGFEVLGESKRIVILHPVIRDGGPWPRKLEQREAVTVYGSLHHILSHSGCPNIKNAFVETSCGEILCGTSAALIGLIDYANQLNKKSA